MEIRVLVTDPIHKDGIELLKKSGFSVDEKPDISHDELVKIVGDYEVLIVRGRTKVTRDVISVAKKLKVIGRAGVGLDNIDLEAARERGITVFNAPEAASVAVAELVFGLLIAVMRGICLGNAALKRGEWIKAKLMGHELRGKVLGIIGLGRIGTEVAKRAKAFEMYVKAYDVREEARQLAESLGVEFVGTSREAFEELLRTSDIITIHVPLTKDTYHLIGKKELSLMKPNAIIINTSRGGVIDENALYEFLKERKIYAAGLDVFEQEPPRDLRLVGLPNVVATPHIGASTEEAQRAASITIAERIIQYFGEKGWRRGRDSNPRGP